MRLLAIVLAAALMSLLAACGNDTGGAPAPNAAGTSQSPSPAESPTATPAPTGSGRPQIAIIPRTIPSDSDQALHAGALKALMEAKRGADGKPTVDLLWQPAENPAQSDSQLHLAQSLIKSGIAALIIAPDDEPTLTAITTAATPTRIPVIALDAPFNTDACRSAISPDDAKIGQLAADRITSLFHGRVRILTLPSPQNPAAVAREKGFRDRVASQMTKYQGGDWFLEIIPAEQSNDAFLSLSKLAVQGIFAPDEGTTLAALENLDKAKLAHTIKLVGVGNSPKLAAALKSGDISALILTDPLATGYQAGKTAIDCIKEKKVDKHIDIPLHVATRENLADPEIAALLHPPIDKYLAN